MGTMIELVASDGHKFSAYRAEPAGKARGALVVVQEIFGVNRHIKSVADGYAADGYLAIAPSYFDRVQRNVDFGYTQPDIQAGLALMQKLNWDKTMKDTTAAVDNVKSAGKTGMLGYCWGGTTAWVGAARLPGLACSVSYYGGGVPGLQSEQPKCPVTFHWGEKDESIPLDGAKKVSAAHPGATSHFYPAGHGFNCDERGSYDAESAKLARTRSLEFLRRHIG